MTLVDSSTDAVYTAAGPAPTRLYLVSPAVVFKCAFHSMLRSPGRLPPKTRSLYSSKSLAARSDRAAANLRPASIASLGCLLAGFLETGALAASPDSTKTSSLGATLPGQGRRGALAPPGLRVYVDAGTCVMAPGMSSSSLAESISIEAMAAAAASAAASAALFLAVSGFEVALVALLRLIGLCCVRMSAPPRVPARPGCPGPVSSSAEPSSPTEKSLSLASSADTQSGSKSLSALSSQAS
mmetsp:Transcript_2210/g.8788  ORF Transcript_2210/g.8788 Transcript_2210/m.8788 type:complete len:241 (+) Transcript_2210:586-1308(+)